MELGDFVKETIVQIVDGMAQANKHFREKKIDAKVNPANVYPNASSNTQIYGFKHKDGTYIDERYIHKISFDVAVYATEGK